MEFKITDTGENRKITVKSWDDASQSWGCDEFSDLEPNFQASHRHDSDGLIYCTSAEYNDLVAWWSDEIEAMNSCWMGHDEDYSDCEPTCLTLFYK